MGHPRTSRSEQRSKRFAADSRRSTLIYSLIDSLLNYITALLEQYGESPLICADLRSSASISGESFAPRLRTAGTGVTHSDDATAGE
jgi:hypothetical protein